MCQVPSGARRILSPDRPAAGKRHNDSTLGPYPAIGGFSPALCSPWLGGRFAKLSFFGNDLTLQSAFDPKPYLLIMFIYLVWRYLSYWHDLGDQGFKNRQRVKVCNLIEKHGMRILGAVSDWREKLARLAKDDPRSRLLKVRTVELGPGPHRYKIILSFVDRDNLSSFESIDWKPDVTLAGLWKWRINARAWAYIVFRTTLFSEYVMPLLIACVPAGNQIRLWVCGL